MQHTTEQWIISILIMVPAYLILPGLSAALEFLNFDNDTVNASSFFKLPAYRAKTFMNVLFV